ncbi:cellulose binding domain-containing protein [Catellatospora sichuanensis]|uniref:cellulose binding domain-containing protein n=1 Tax=Catellatospora sichuanensis TaxID=1969805 RepID=UPI001181DC13|nr:cellulose binding domain-containing protein [Catellatospora sichuanensis]
MSRPTVRAALMALLGTLVAATAVVVAAPTGSAAAVPTRIMALGDSITGSPGCWRATLWNRLQSTGYTNIDMVGTLPAQGCGVAHDGDNEGHGGFLATNVANQNQLVGWLSATLPDVVLMHFGTNDVWSNLPNTQILTAFGKLVDQMRASNPAMKILVAKIIPMNPSSCTECAARVVSFNNAIPAWAAGKTTAQSPITVVDQWTGFNTATDTYDGVHPNAAGDQKMSDRWYPALTAALSGVTPSNPPSPSASPSASPSPSARPSPSVSPSPSAPPSPSVSPSPSRPPSPSPSSGSTGKSCSVTYVIIGQWPGGFQGELRVVNNGTVPISGWSVRFTFPNGQVITQSWNGQYTQTGSTVTTLNVSWNGQLSPGTGTAAGFLATYQGTNGTPVPVCTAL